jgi:hypothetical protein
MHTCCIRQRDHCVYILPTVPWLADGVAQEVIQQLHMAPCTNIMGPPADHLLLYSQRDSPIPLVIQYGEEQQFGIFAEK